MKKSNFIEITILHFNDMDSKYIESKSIINISMIKDISLYNNNVLVTLNEKAPVRVKESYDYFKRFLIGKELND